MGRGSGRDACGWCGAWGGVGGVGGVAAVGAGRRGPEAGHDHVTLDMLWRGQRHMIMGAGPAAGLLGWWSESGVGY
jgi:hypothetical protein